MTEERKDEVSTGGPDSAFEDARRHLDPVVDHLNDKFADAPVEHVAEVVETVFTELSAEATIPDHLAALTQHRAQDRLNAESAASADGPRTDGSDRSGEAEPEAP